MDFAGRYRAELGDLTLNSRPLIGTLTTLAGEAAGVAAPDVAAAVLDRVETCDPAHRLYALYLVDSIAKNVGGPYPALFAPRLARAFSGAWAAHPPSRPALGRLQGTWDGVFDGSVLAAVRATVAAPVAAAAAASVHPSAYPAAPYPAPYGYGGPPPPPPPPVAAYGYGGGPPAAAYPPPAAAAPPPPPFYHQPYGAPPPPPPPPHYGAPPPPPPPPDLLSSLTSLAAAGVIAPPPPPRGSASPAAAAAAAAAPPPAKAGRPTRRSKRGGSRGVGEPEGGGLSPFRAAPSPWRPEDEAAAAPASASTAWAPPPSSSPHYPPASDPYAGASLGPPPVAGGPVAAAAPPSPGRGDLTSRRVRGPPDAARGRLLAATDASRPARADAAAVRARRAAARAESGRPLSRPWYASADDWIAGTAAAADAGPSFFEGKSGGAAGTARAAPPRAATPPSAPADDAQRACALTGEPFDSYYDDARGEWRYRDAVRVDAAGGAALGLPPGVLVKASAIDAGGGAADPVAAGEAELAVARDLVAATAGEEEEGGPRVKRVKAEPV